MKEKRKDGRKIIEKGRKLGYFIYTFLPFFFYRRNQCILFLYFIQKKKREKVYINYKHRLKI